MVKHGKILKKGMTCKAKKTSRMSLWWNLWSGAFHKKYYARFFFWTPKRTFLLPHDVAGFPRSLHTTSAPEAKEKRTNQKLGKFPHHRTFPPPFFFCSSILPEMPENQLRKTRSWRVRQSWCVKGGRKWEMGKGKGSQWSNMGVPKIGVPQNGWFMGTPIFGNTHMFIHSLTFDDHFLHVIGSPFCLSQ